VVLVSTPLQGRLGRPGTARRRRHVQERLPAPDARRRPRHHLTRRPTYPHCLPATL